MKTLKGKTLMSILYAVILSIPMISILSRVIYVQSNKNAYQSYSGNNNIEYSQITNDNIKVGNALTFINEGTYTNTNTQSTSYVGYEMISNIQTTSTQLKTALENGTYFGWYYTTNSQTIYVWDSNYQTLFGGSGTNDTISFDFVLTSYNQTNIFLNLSFFRTKQVNSFYNLDNVFDYSVSKLVDEQNFGQLNFFQWFGNLFLNDAQSNMLYVRFVNWYLNYALLVSLMQIIFLCLMWFVNFSRRLLERGMNYDW